MCLAQTLNLCGGIASLWNTVNFCNGYLIEWQVHTWRSSHLLNTSNCQYQYRRNQATCNDQVLVQSFPTSCHALTTFFLSLGGQPSWKSNTRTSLSIVSFQNVFLLRPARGCKNRWLLAMCFIFADAIIDFSIWREAMVTNLKYCVHLHEKLNMS